MFLLLYHFSFGQCLMYSRLFWNLLCSHEWAWILGFPASTSQVWELKARDTTFGLRGARNWTQSFAHVFSPIFLLLIKVLSIYFICEFIGWSKFVCSTFVALYVVCVFNLCLMCTCQIFSPTLWVVSSLKWWHPKVDGEKTHKASTLHKEL